RQDERDLQHIVLRHRHAPGRHIVAHARHLVLRDAEVHPDRVDRHHVGELGAVGHRVDVGALALLRTARIPRHGGADGGVAEVQLGLAQLRLGGVHRRIRRVVVALRAVEVGARHRVLRGERLGAIEVGLRGGEARLLREHLALRRVELRLEGLRIELEQDLPLLDQLTLVGSDAIEEARESRHDFHAARALGLGDETDRLLDRRGRRRHHADLGRRALRRRLLLRAAAGKSKRKRAERGHRLHGSKPILLSAVWTCYGTKVQCPGDGSAATVAAMTKGWLALALWVLAGSCLAQSPTLDKIRKTGTITLGYVDGALPFSFVREVKPEGYSVELCERIAGELRRSLKLEKLETRWVALTIQNRLEAVRKGQVDLECSTTSQTLARRQ